MGVHLPETYPTCEPAGGRGIQVRLLGPIRVTADGTELTLGSGNRRAVLAALAATPGWPIPREELVQAVWGDDPPPSAVGNLYTHISSLRQVLEPDRSRWSAGAVLPSGGGTYSLLLPAEAVDACRFDALRRHAQSLRTAGRAQDELATLARALDLWQGPEALAGVPGPFASQQRARLGELYLAAVERRAELMLELGRGVEIADALRREVALHPMRESLVVLAIRALADQGRFDEAARLYANSHDRLVREAGAGPGPALRELYADLACPTPARADGRGASLTPGCVNRRRAGSLPGRAQGRPVVAAHPATMPGPRRTVAPAADDWTGSLRVRVLGPVGARVGDREVDLGPARRRALFAVLAANANRALSRDELIDAVWGRSVPSTALGNIYTYISGLRQSLRVAGADEVLVSSPAGYALLLEPDALDLNRFERLRERARNLAARGQILDAVGQLDAALALWRGEAYANLTGRFVETERHRLGEQRPAAAELRARLLLATGGDDSLVAELVAMVRDHPLRESLHELLINALRQAGRPAEALVAAQAARRVLALELGVQPGPAIQSLYRELLAG